jgi:cellulose synthase/poly-beta-1,6-N-acetylglucosamine synthase-like glycosyltransferase
MKKKVLFSVGTTAYNEAKNISRFIDAVQKQKLPKIFKLKELLVVASGCTDNTLDIVKKCQKKDKRIKLLVQKKRKGKVNAVNIVLKKATSRLLILQSADTIPEKSCYKHLLLKLINPNVGLTAGKIIPTDNHETFFGFANHFRWKLHHKINLEYPQRPKVGELIAFKRIFERIPPKAIVDEASVEPLIHLQGYEINYVPSAIIYNQGPKNLKEYLSRRRSIQAGHYMTKQKYAYEVVTYSGLRILPIYMKNLEFNLKYISYALLVLMLEVLARIFGYIDIISKTRDQALWKVSSSSKQLSK